MLSIFNCINVFLNVIVSQQGIPPKNKNMPNLDEYEGIDDVAHYSVLYVTGMLSFNGMLNPGIYRKYMGHPKGLGSLYFIVGLVCDTVGVLFQSLFINLRVKVAP